MNFADGFVLILTIIFIAYFAYATPIIMVGIWRYKKHGFASEEPGEDWDPPNVSILVPVKNEEKVVARLLDAITRLDYPRENLEVIVVEESRKIEPSKSVKNSRDNIHGSKSFTEKQAWARGTL